MGWGRGGVIQARGGGWYCLVGAGTDLLSAQRFGTCISRDSPGVRIGSLSIPAACPCGMHVRVGGGVLPQDTGVLCSWPALALPVYPVTSPRG